MFDKLKNKAKKYGLMTALVASPFLSANSANIHSESDDKNISAENSKPESKEANKLISFEEAAKQIKEDKLSFKPLEKPTGFTREIYDNINILLEKMEPYLANGGKVEDLYKDVGNIFVMQNQTTIHNTKHKNFYGYISNTILMNKDYFKVTSQKLGLRRNNIKNNTEIALKKLGSFFEFPHKVFSSERSIDIALEFEFGKCSSAPNAKRTIEETAKVIANLYNGYYKSNMYNLPEGKEVLNEIDIQNSKETSWGNYETGFNKNLVGEFYCTSTTELKNKETANSTIAKNMRLSYLRTERLNKLISEEMKAIGNKDLENLFNNRAIENKTKALSVLTKLNKGEKVSFTNDEMDKYLTVGDNDKNNSRVSILKIKVPKSRAACNAITSSKTELISVSFQKNNNRKTIFYNKDCEKFIRNYIKYAKEHAMKINEFHEQDKVIIFKEKARIHKVAQASKAQKNNTIVKNEKTM
jgi:hypothetical protein